jgi:NAD(P)-dependent dehydrogenase (short-subunit alcohol dehydrogenase family)
MTPSKIGRLSGKLAIVTGGSRGIGEAIAAAFVREGARVVITARKPEGLAPVAARINAACPEAVVARACHVGKTDQILELLGWVEKELGLPDVLVNNAGTNPYFGPMLGVTPELFEKTFEVNLRGAFEATRHLCQRWIEKDRPGTVINIASILGQSAAPLQGVYGMTKAAVISMTRTLAFELGRQKIRVNAIAPGLIDTRLSQALIGSPDILKLFTDRTALGRHGQPPEIAELAVFQATEESAYVTGQTFNVDGGYSIS